MVCVARLKYTINQFQRGGTYIGFRCLHITHTHTHTYLCLCRYPCYYASSNVDTLQMVKRIFSVLVVVVASLIVVVIFLVVIGYWF